MSILAIDFGGTRTRAAWYSADLEMIARSETPSLVDQPAAHVLKRIIETARSVVPQGMQPAAIGISAPGPLDAPRGVIHHALTLPGWQDVPLAVLLSEAFGGAAAYMQNDANLAAVAEAERGAARGCDPALYLTLSTGIGGGAVIGGRLFTGARGLAIEPGHIQCTLPDGRILRLEDLASGTGIAARARERLQRDDAPSTLRALSEINAKVVGEAAVSGDALAISIIEEAGYWLGLALVDLLHLFNPQVVVIGGSVARLGDLLFDPARKIIRERILHPDFYTEDLIRPAQLGDDVCLVGAALLAARGGRL